MEIVKKYTEEFYSSSGRELSSGIIILFETSEGTKVGIYQGIKNGRIIIQDYMSGDNHTYIPKTIKSVLVANIEVL